MGGFSDKVKYYAAYRSIKFVMEKIRDMDGTIDDIYLVNNKTITKFIEILNKRNILEYISDLTKRSEVNVLDKKLQDDFGDYELEKNIELFDINDNNYDNFKNYNFILVDKDFLKNMKIKEDHFKYTIIVNKDGIKIELTSDIFIIIEETEKKGIYKFVEKQEKPPIVNEESCVEEKEEQDKEEIDPDVYMYRYIPDKKEEEKEKGKEEEEEGKEEGKEKEEEKEEVKEEEKLNNISLNISANNSHIKSGKAPIAKLDEIIKILFCSLQKSKEREQEIFQAIQKKINELNIENELKFQNNLNIIQNIKESIETLIDNYGQNQNSNNLDNTHNSNYTYYHNNESQNLIQFDNNIDESSIPLINNNESIISSNQRKIKYPFNFIKVSIDICNNCNNIINEEDENPYYYKINLNQKIDNLDDCFKLKFHKNCEKCNKGYLECSYKFKTTPNILIIIFDKPKENKNFINSNLIKENIDLKAHLFNSNNIDNNKYELIKVLYVFNDINDENLYMDIPENEKKEYIPHIVFYIKKD